MVDLTIRKIKTKKTGKEYYQAGYYESRRWVNVLHLGSAQQIVCKLRELQTNKERTLKLAEDLKQSHDPEKVDAH